MRRLRSAITFALVLIAGLGLAVTSAAPSSAQISPDNGNVEWEGWSLDYEISGLADGMSLKNVTFNGNKVLERASLPVMNVFYEDDDCGPYADRLGGAEPITAREITYGGERWIEIGMEDTIGAYVMYQVWYLSENGVIDAHIFSKGLQCTTYHEHLPFWRLDFDIDGFENDQILRRQAGGLAVEPTEFDLRADDAIDHGWVVQDALTGSSVAINFDDGTWNVPGSVVPETDYDLNRVYGRAYKPDEAEWSGGPTRNYEVGNEGENLDSADVVLWYTGWMPHWPDEGEALWHSTGIRMTVNANGAPVDPEPEPVAPEPPEPVAPEPVIPEPVAPEPVIPEPVAPEPVIPEPVAPEPVIPEPVAPEPIIPEPVAPEPVIPEPAEPVVDSAIPAGAFVAHRAPGIVEAEDFNLGPQLAGYRDSDSREYGTAVSYRNSPVDIWRTVGADGYTIGRTRDGEWLEYTVRFDEAARYRVDLRVASGHADPGAIEVTIDGNRIGQLDVNPRGWWTFRTLSVGTANINPGLHKIRLTWKDGAQINLDHLAISEHFAPPDGDFGCVADAGVVTWSDHLQPKYWIYRSVDGGETFRWVGRALNSATFTDPAPTAGAVYQVHYQGIPRSVCIEAG